MRDSLRKLDQAQPRALLCERCGITFTCDPLGRCWCMDESIRLPMPGGSSDCICRNCLRAEAARLR